MEYGVCMVHGSWLIMQIISLNQIHNIEMHVLSSRIVLWLSSRIVLWLSSRVVHVLPPEKTWKVLQVSIHCASLIADLSKRSNRCPRRMGMTRIHLLGVHTSNDVITPQRERIGWLSGLNDRSFFRRFENTRIMCEGKWMRCSCPIKNEYATWSLNHKRICLKRYALSVMP